MATEITCRIDSNIALRDTSTLRFQTGVSRGITKKISYQNQRLS